MGKRGNTPIRGVRIADDLWGMVKQCAADYPRKDLPKKDGKLQKGIQLSTWIRRCLEDAVRRQKKNLPEHAFREMEMGRPVKSEVPVAPPAPQGPPQGGESGPPPQEFQFVPDPQ